MAPIKVLVVEDSDLMALALTEALESDRKIKVVGRAANGREALKLVSILNPDLITMDVWMPVMDGFETVERIMTSRPTPILVITGIRLKEDVQVSLRMIAAGALDVIEKPEMSDETQWKQGRLELVNRVKSLAELNPFQQFGLLKTPAKISQPVTDRTITRSNTTARLRQVPAPGTAPLEKHYKVVVIASSTGGPTALLRILQGLPRNFPASILVVQHISQGFTQGLVDWLGREISLAIRVAKEGETPEAGLILVAPDRQNMILGAGGRIQLLPGDVSGLSPNGDILMESVARVMKDRAIGIVLTGMGSDGAVGLKAMRDAGAYTIAQDELTSLIYGMPKVAYDIGAAEEVLPLDAIAPRLSMLCSRSFTSPEGR
jgi:two-component system chemotaxis response regulator CheB